MNSTLVITPSREAIQRALESWQWLPIQSREPVLVTAFGDIFFCSQGRSLVSRHFRGHLSESLLHAFRVGGVTCTTEGEDRYCLAGFVERACREGMALRDGQCYDFTLHPVVGGKLEYANVSAEGLRGRRAYRRTASRTS